MYKVYLLMLLINSSVVRGRGWSGAGVGVGVGECSHFSMSGRRVVTVKECAWFSMRRVEDGGGWPLIVLEQCACFSTQGEWSGAREEVIM